MSIEATIEQLEARKAELREAVSMKESHDRLLKNRDFRKLILEQFCVQDCARYARESADPMLTKDQRDDALAMAQAAGHFKRYLQISYHMCSIAEEDIKRIDTEIDELRAEGGQ